MIKQYENNAALAAAGTPTDESRVALVKDINKIAIDGVNVQKTTPSLFDAVYKDADGKIHIIENHTVQPSLLPSSWTYQGPFIGNYDEDRGMVISGNFASLPTRKFLDVCQYAWTDVVLDGEEHEKTIGIRTALDWTVNTNIAFTYTATTLAEAAAAVQAAIESALESNAAEQALWWAYADEDNHQVVVQRDICSDHRFYICAGLTLISWEDMPASTEYLKANGSKTNYRGIQNITGGAAYWSTNGRELTTHVAVGSESGNVNPMKKTEFLNSEHAEDIRAYYGSYENYLRGEFGIMWPQPKTGVFGLPDGKYLTEKYGPKMAPTKTGGIKAKFPALNWAYSLGDDSYLWGVYAGTIMMKDENLARINALQSRVGKVQFSAAANRWYAQRYYVLNAWMFNGYYRTLNYSYVCNGYQVGAVKLFPLNK